MSVSYQVDSQHDSNAQVGSKQTFLLHQAYEIISTKQSCSCSFTTRLHFTTKPRTVPLNTNQHKTHKLTSQIQSISLKPHFTQTLQHTLLLLITLRGPQIKYRLGTPSPPMQQ